MWSDLFAGNTGRAAAFITDCNRRMRFLNVPARTELQWSTLLATSAWTSTNKACLVRCGSDEAKQALTVVVTWVGAHTEISINVDADVAN